MFVYHVRFIIRSLLRNIGSNTLRSVTGRKLYFHGAGIILTILIILSGIDWHYFLFFRTHIFLQIILFPAVMMGGLFPMIVPLGLYIKGVRKRNPSYIRTAIALGQAMMISLLIISCYKVITGRPPPELFEGDADEDYSHAFRFGIYRGGIFHGWPSGHTASAFAMAATVTHLYPENRRVKKRAYIYASYIAIGISTNIHWLSDVVAAIFIGVVIGTVVGNDFYRRDLSSKEMPYPFEKD